MSTLRLIAEELLVSRGTVSLSAPTRSSACRRSKRLEHAGPAGRLCHPLGFARSSRDSGSFVKLFGGWPFGAPPAGLRSGKAARRSRIVEFAEFMLHERGLPVTIALRCQNGVPISRSALRQRQVTQRCDYFRSRLATCCQRQRGTLRASVGSDLRIFSAFVFPIR